jgi:hypothetical protein
MTHPALQLVAGNGILFFWTRIGKSPYVIQVKTSSIKKQVERTDRKT